MLSLVVELELELDVDWRRWRWRWRWSWSWSWSWAILFDYLVNINRDAHPVLLVIHIPASIHIRSNNKISGVRPSIMLFP